MTADQYSHATKIMCARHACLGCFVIATTMCYGESECAGAQRMLIVALRLRRCWPHLTECLCAGAPTIVAPAPASRPWARTALHPVPMTLPRCSTRYADSWSGLQSRVIGCALRACSALFVTATHTCSHPRAHLGQFQAAKYLTDMAFVPSADTMSQLCPDPHSCDCRT